MNIIQTKQILRVSFLVVMLSLPTPLVAAPEDAKTIVPILNLLLDAGTKFKAMVTGLLNDTGIDFTGDPAGNNPNDSVCSNAVLHAQDCHAGRDATHNDDSDGRAGFSFVKLNNAGELLPASAGNWNCVGDNVTGLMWEVKASSNEDSLHTNIDTFTWFNTNSNTNGGDSGVENTETGCFGRIPGDPQTYCNTQAYVNRVNTAGWCGYSDWRLPTREEARSIMHYSSALGNLEGAYFPYSVLLPVHYWSTSPLANDHDQAWIANFATGYNFASGKDKNRFIRLVRSNF